MVRRIPQEVYPKVTRIIESRYGLRPEGVEGGSWSVTSSTHRSSLEEEARFLRNAGAEVEVVACDREHIEFASFFEGYVSGVKQTIDAIDPLELRAVASGLLAARDAGKKILLFGNGGSAAIASHFAADLAKQRFVDESLMFRALSLADNSPLVTATANDVGYEWVFSQQIKLLVEPGDVAFGISSSGKSENIVNALRTAKDRGAHTIAMVGFDGGEALTMADTVLHVPTGQGKYGFVEDAHSVACHMLAIYLFERDKRQLRGSTSTVS